MGELESRLQDGPNNPWVRLGGLEGDMSKHNGAVGVRQEWDQTTGLFTVCHGSL